MCLNLNLRGTETASKGTSQGCTVRSQLRDGLRLGRHYESEKIIPSPARVVAGTRARVRAGSESFARGDADSDLGTNMSYFLPHLPSGWHVDEAIKSEEDRVVVIRFGHDWDSQCMTMDETLYAVAEKVQNYAVIYLTDITEVPDFNKVRLFISYHARF